MRRRLRNEIAALLAIKAVALTLIWYAFFSPVHRLHVDGHTTGERFRLTTPVIRDSEAEASRAVEKSHD